MSNYPPPGSTGPTRPMNPQPQAPQPPNQPPYQQNYYQQNPYQQGQPQTPKKGGGGLRWVLLGCGGFILIGILVVGGIGYFGYQKAKQAGLDPDLMHVSELWRDADALRAHAAAPHMKPWGAAMRDAGVVGRDLKMYEVGEGTPL